ncbi:hypothetical protein LTR37_005076 [Vermiconidia calcicola]|uniref:Uncharacterized protein n=1 Tax=Vermiconidia calcicola TaxID=1690605 RepID=A0ACC3NM46_9PEZI|nr:hypothetical protein LTR37_005076 [Vermiconidia calcicola]
MASRWVLGVVLLLTFAGFVTAKNHFDTFYPQLRPVIAEYLRYNCSQEYRDYLDDVRSDNELVCIGCAAAPVTDCLLNTFHEVDKANMASAAVILGILPTSLSLAGSTTAETGLLSLRRPLLAFLIGAGAPAVNPTRTFHYADPKDLLYIRRKSIRAPRLTGFFGVVVLVLEYLFACLAVTNLSIVSWQLCVRTICSFAQDTVYMPALWALMAEAIHIAGAIAVALRVQLTEEPSKRRRPHSHRFGRNIFQTIRKEFTLSRAQPAATLEYDEESYWFLIVSWITASGTVLHIVFGTLVFSSLLFITTLDAVIVVFQLLGSTIVVEVKEDDISELELRGMWPAKGTWESGDRITLIAPSSTKITK